MTARDKAMLNMCWKLDDTMSDFQIQNWDAGENIVRHHYVGRPAYLSDENIWL